MLLMELNNPEAESDYKEKVVMEFVSSLAEKCEFKKMFSLITDMKAIWKDITNVRATKIIKKTLHVLPSSHFHEILSFITDLINWADRENKKLLKLDLECKRINALLRLGDYKECLESIKRVLRDLKKFDDKENQIRLYICESRAFYELKDVSRARSSLTAARVLAVSSYCPHELQAQIDLLNGMFICDDHQYHTAYSYFLEAIDSFNLSKDSDSALLAARYFLMTKIIDKKWNEVTSFTKSKLFLPFLNDEFVKMLLEVKESCQSRDLKTYQVLLDEKRELIDKDLFIKSHLYFIYGLLFESNILKIIEPYSNIKIVTIAAALGFSVDQVEEKVRNMILDEKINGTIDHVSGYIFLFDRKKGHEKYDDHMSQLDVLKDFISTL